MNILHSVTDMMGGTPLLRLHRMEKDNELNVALLVKPEGLNPGGSAKDRVALNMVLDAEAKGAIAPGATLIEPTSGNTGIGLACVAAARGYRLLITMPDSMSAERIRLMEAYGAQVILTPGAQGMAGAIAKAEALAAETPGSYLTRQFENPANPEAHQKTTGPEIWRDTEGNVDIFVAGVGTGGTITGVGRYLKAQNPAVGVVAVEPASSPVLSGGKAGPHGLMGIGAGFVPKALDVTVLDEVVTVTEEEAYAAARRLATREGLLCGITGGAALHAAIQVGKRPENAGKTLVVLLPDSGERYLSTPLFAKENG